MTPSDLKTLLSAAWSAAWDHGDVDALDALLDPAYVRHGQRGSAQSARELKANILTCRAGFPDLITRIEDCLVEGDRIATRWRSEGTHLAPMFGVPATARRVTVSGATFSRLVDDRIVEEWVTWDPRELLGALGVITLDSAELDSAELDGDGVTALWALRHSKRRWSRTSTASSSRASPWSPRWTVSCRAASPSTRSPRSR